MTVKLFKRNVLAVIVYFLVLIMAGIALRFTFPDEKAIQYAVFKDLIPLAISIPAAWLGYCLQRRLSYLKDVRDLWSKIVLATQDSIQYTYLECPPQAEFAKVQKSLSVTIEELRSVFANLGATEGEIGVFPFESLKNIHKVVSSLGFGALQSEEDRRLARKSIIDHYKKLRQHYLANCARGVPDIPDSPYIV